MFHHPEEKNDPVLTACEGVFRFQLSDDKQTGGESRWIKPCANHVPIPPDSFPALRISGLPIYYRTRLVGWLQGIGCFVLYCVSCPEMLIAHHSVIECLCSGG